MSSEASAAHIESVREQSLPGRCLGPDAPTQSVRNPAWFRTVRGRFEPTAARRALHRELRAEVLADVPNVLAERKAIVLAGPPGAGKSEAKNQLLSPDERETYLTVDPDVFKAKLLGRAAADGTYETWIKPAEVKQLESQGERFFPMELASLVHEESSIIGQEMRLAAMRQGLNIIVDGVLASAEKALALGRQLEENGYDVKVVDVEATFEISENGIRQRWSESYENALNGKDPLGGRWVPSEYARDVFDGPGGKSKPEYAAETLSMQCGAVMEYRLYRVSMDEETGKRISVLEVKFQRTRQGGHLLKSDLVKVQKLAKHTQGKPATFTTHPLPSTPDHGRE